MPGKWNRSAPDPIFQRPQQECREMGMIRGFAVVLARTTRLFRAPESRNGVGGFLPRRGVVAPAPGRARLAFFRSPRLTFFRVPRLTLVVRVPSSTFTARLAAAARAVPRSLATARAFLMRGVG